MKRILNLYTFPKMSTYLNAWLFLTFSDREFIFKFRFAVIFASLSLYLHNFPPDIFVYQQTPVFRLRMSASDRPSCTDAVVH